jgi:enediyne biosynthesis protein E4
MGMRVGVPVLCCMLLLAAVGLTWAGPESTLVPIGGTVSAIVPDPSASRLYVADRDNARVLVLSTQNGSILATIPVAAAPVGLALDPDGGTLYVAEKSAGTIGVIDLALAQRVGGIDVGVKPEAIAAGRPGRLYVVGLSDEAFLTDDLRIVDTDSGAVLGSFFTDYFGQPAVAISPDGNTLCVLTSGVGVQVVDVSTDAPSLGAQVRITPYLHDLWVNGQGDKLYVGARIYDLPDLTPSSELAIGATTVTTFAHDQTIASCHFPDTTVYFWDAASLALRGTFVLQGSPSFLRVSPFDGAVVSALGGTVELDAIRLLTVTAEASPASVPSGGSATLNAFCREGRGHGGIAWSWSDGGAGGTFSPSATVRNPTYTVPENLSASPLLVTLTVTATGTSSPPLATGAATTTLTVAPVRTLTVTAEASPSAVDSGGTTALTSAVVGSHEPGGYTLSWDDGGWGGTFYPSATARSPVYRAPANTSGSAYVIPLTVTAKSRLPGARGSATVELTVWPTAHTVTVTASAAPSTVASAGTTALTATAVDSQGHSGLTWSWSDGGTGGAFSPSATVQNPSYTAPANDGATDREIALTVTATCARRHPRVSGSATTTLTVASSHGFTVTASADPTSVASGGTTALTAAYTDSQGHGIAAWGWSDGGAGGTFSPSATDQNPSYTAPANTGATDLTVTLTVSATCDGADPRQGSATATLTVQTHKRFEDVGAALGLPTALGGAWGDYDNDGYPDLYLGGIWESHGGALWHNNGNGTFTEVGASLGIQQDSSTWEDWGASWGDYNNDGRLDLAVAGGNHRVFLYRNDGDHFMEVGTAAASFPYYGHGLAWGDYDGDNWLDLYVSEAESDISRLFHNNQDGTFTEVNDAVGMGAAPAGIGSSAAWADYNDDGRMDLLVARERSGSGNIPRLYLQLGDGTFADQSALANLSDVDNARGLGWGDYDNDGWLDFYLSAGHSRPHWLYRNNGDGTFTQTTSAAGMTSEAAAYGTAWADYDNDGWLDLAVSNEGTTPTLYHNAGNGTFTETAAAQGLRVDRHGTTAIWADYDRDGRVDLLLGSNSSGPSSVLYHNTGDGADGNWLRLRALTDANGDTSDGDPVRDALGAKVQVNLDNDPSLPAGRTLQRVIDGGSSFCGQNEQVAQFGLGASTAVAVRVRFPDGTTVSWTDVPVNQEITVNDGAS